MNLTPEAQSALRNASTRGTKLTLPPGLDRKLYVKVNEAIEACGGRWSRRDQAHVFQSDAASAIAAVLQTGSVETDREQGWFPTPAELAQRMAEEADLSPGCHVLEPSAGEGALVFAALEAIGEPGACVACVEKDRGRHDRLSDALEAHAKQPSARMFCGDFLAFTRVELGAPYDRIVMNPPFAKGDDVRHVMHAASMLAKGGRLVAIVSAGVGFRKDKATRVLVDRVKASGGTLETLPDDTFKDQGPGTGVRTLLLTLNG